VFVLRSVQGADEEGDSSLEISLLAYPSLPLASIKYCSESSKVNGGSFEHRSMNTSLLAEGPLPYSYLDLI
jgi:hypothetical protein